MLKNTGVEVIHSIEHFTVDAKNKTISVEIATGIINDGAFVSDGRGLVKYRISNELDQNRQKTDILIVDAAGQVTLSLLPLNDNPLEINGILQEHISGQQVICNGHAEGDEITARYYYLQLGRNWFNETAEFRQVDHPEYIGMNDYEYNSKRLWSILLEMGLVSGVIV